MKFSDLMIDMSDQLNEDELFKTDNINGFSISEIVIGNKRSRVLAKPEGRYTVIEFDNEHFSPTSLERLLLLKLQSYFGVNAPGNVLIAGFGNPFVAADSFGPETVRGVASKCSGKNKVYKIETQVEGITGIDSAEYLSAVCKLTEPKLVILLDSMLTAKSENLLKTLQICDTPFEILDANRSKRSALNALNEKYKFISIGYTTTIDAYNFKADNHNNLSGRAESSFLFTPVESGLYIDKLSPLVSKCLNKLLSER